MKYFQDIVAVKPISQSKHTDISKSATGTLPAGTNVGKWHHSLIFELSVHQQIPGTYLQSMQLRCYRNCGIYSFWISLRSLLRQVQYTKRYVILLLHNALSIYCICRQCNGRQIPGMALLDLPAWQLLSHICCRILLWQIVMNSRKFGQHPTWSTYTFYMLSPTLRTQRQESN